MDEYWTSAEELIRLMEQKTFVEVTFKGRKLRLAWKEIPVGHKINVTFPKPISEMTPEEKETAMKDSIIAETLARIAEAGETEGCFNNNILSKETWEKFPDRLKSMIISEMYDLKNTLMKDF